MNYTRLLQLNKQFGKFYDQQFVPFSTRTGLTLGEIHVLLFLFNNPGCDTARDITDLRGIAKSQVSQAVERLCASGLLRRRPDGYDRRLVHLSITDAGLPLAQECRRIQTACGRQLLSCLSRDQIRQLETLLDMIWEHSAALFEEVTP